MSKWSSSRAARAAQALPKPIKLREVPNIKLKSAEDPEYRLLQREASPKTRWIGRRWKLRASWAGDVGSAAADM